MKQRILACLCALLLLPGLAQAKIFLPDTSSTLQVVTASGVSTIHMYASWADITTTALTPGSSSARVTTATTTTLVASPGASTQRQIKGFSIRNNHASSSNAITVQFFDGTNATELIKYTLLAGETLQWGEDENFRIIDASGQVKSTVALQTGSNTIGALSANQSVNVSQMNGVATSMGVGASGTGTQRVASLIHDGTDTAQVTATSGGSLQVECTAGCSGSGGTSSNFGSAFPTPGTAAGFTDGTNMVAGRVVTSAPGTSDAGLVVRPISPASSTIGSAVPSAGVQVTGSDGTNARAIATDTSGNVKTVVQSLPALAAGSNTIGALTANQSVNISQMNGVATTMGNGVSGTGVQRVTIASDSTGQVALASGSTVAVTQPTGTNLHMVCDSGCSSSAGFADNGAFTFGTTAINPIGGVFDDVSSNTATENSAAIARITQNKAIHTNLRNASGTEIGTSGNPIRTDPTGTTTQPVNVAQMNGTTITMGNGVAGTGVQRVTIASDSTGQVALAAGSNTVGNVGVLPVTSGGTSVCYLTSAATTNATNCKASAGQLYGYDLVNTTTTLYYLRIYNLSTAPTCSSATGFIRTIPIPPAAAAGGAGGVARAIPSGEAYGTGLGFCLTGGGSSTDNTNAATGVYVSLNYK